MSRRSVPVLTSTSVLLLLLLPFLLLLDTSTAAITAEDISCSLKICATVDAAALREYVTSLNIGTLNDTDTNELPSEEAVLPFGSLTSDWPRFLLLLQKDRPNFTSNRDYLLRLSRIMLAMYFDSEDTATRWKIQPLDGYTSGRETIEIVNPGGPLTEPEDQQANNVTLGSTAQNGSTWINASSVATGNNEEQTPSGKLPGNQNDLATTSHYDSSTPPTNFNQIFLTSRFNNEASGNNSNETFPLDNKDESAGLETSGGFFAPLEAPQGDVSVDNEVIHVRSEENFLMSRYVEKDKGDPLNNTNANTSDDSLSIDDRRSDKSIPSNTFSSFEEIPITKSIEDFFNGNDTDVSLEGESIEFNSTKSIEDFFNFGENVTSDTNSHEIKSDVEPVTEIFSSAELDVTEEPNFITTSTEGNSESNEKHLTTSFENLVNEMESENWSLESNETSVNKSEEDFSKASHDKITEAMEIVAATQMSTDSWTTLDENHMNVSPYILRSEEEQEELESTTEIHKKGSYEELIRSEETSTESNFTGDDNPTTLAQLISGRFSAAYSNEITGAFDSTTPANGTEDRSVKYPDTLAAISLVYAGDQDKAEERAHTLATEIDGAEENRTTDRTDDLFRETTIERQPEDDWPLATSVSIDHESYEVRSPLAFLSRNILMIPQRDHNNDIATGELSHPDASLLIEDEEVGNDDAWELKEGAFNPSMSLWNQQVRSSSDEIAAESRMNKRKIPERARAEQLDVERQYPTFLGRESRQTQFAEKRGNEEE